MGRRKKEIRPTENTSVMATMQRHNPDSRFEICPVCNQWALLWTEGSNTNLYDSMHPAGCYDTPAGAKIRAELKQKNWVDVNVSLF